MKTHIKAVLLAGALAAQVVPAKADLVVVVHPQSGVTAMTNEQSSRFFLGKSTQMTPIDQPEGSPVRAEFYKKVAGKDGSQVKALWAKLVFTGAAMQPREAGSSADVKKAVAADPRAIGYIEKSAADATVKVVLTAP